MKKPITTILVSCMILLLATACKNTGKKTESPITESEAMQEPYTQSDIEVGPMDVTYFLFHDYETRMSLPEAWMDEVSIRKSPSNDDGALTEYVAVFTGPDEKENEFLGAIYVYTKKQWEAVSEEWKGIYTKVGEVNGYLYFYKSPQSNPYDETTEIGKEYDRHVIQSPDAPRLINIEKQFLHTISLDNKEWNVLTTIEGGLDAMNKDSIEISLGTSTGSGRGIKSIPDVKNNIIKPDKTAKILNKPTKIGGYDAVCYETGEINKKEYACVAYIQTGQEDFKMLAVAGRKKQAEQIKSIFTDACNSFRKRQ